MRITMHRFLLASALLLSFAAPVRAQEPAKVTTLFSRDLSDIPGKEGMMLLVEYPPGGADPVHCHNANAFVYVLEGSIIMQVKGAEPVTLHAGQTYDKRTERAYVELQRSDDDGDEQLVVIVFTYRN